MAVNLQSEITLPLRAEWLARTPINSGDPADIVEPAQQLYAREGGDTWQVVGPFETASTSFTTDSDLDNGDLDEYDALLLARRPDTDDEYQLSLNVWGWDVEARVTVTRLDTDGTTHQVAQVTASEVGGTLADFTVDATLTETEVRDDGSASNNPVPLVVEVDYRHLDGATTEAHLEYGIFRSAELAAADLP